MSNSFTKKEDNNKGINHELQDSSTSLNYTNNNSGIKNKNCALSAQRNFCKSDKLLKLNSSKSQDTLEGRSIIDLNLYNAACENTKKTINALFKSNLQSGPLAAHCNPPEVQSDSPTVQCDSSSVQCDSPTVQLTKKLNLKKEFFCVTEEIIYPTVKRNNETNFSIKMFSKEKVKEFLQVSKELFDKNIDDDIFEILKNCRRPVSEEVVNFIFKVDNLNFTDFDQKIRNGTNQLSYFIDNHNCVLNASELERYENQDVKTVQKNEDFLNLNGSNPMNNYGKKINYDVMSSNVSHRPSVTKYLNSAESFEEMLEEFEKLTSEVHESLLNLSNSAKSKKRNSIEKYQNKTSNKLDFIDKERNDNHDCGNYAIVIPNNSNKELTKLFSNSNNVNESPTINRKELFKTDPLVIDLAKYGCSSTVNRPSGEFNKNDANSSKNLISSKSEEIFISYDGQDEKATQNEVQVSVLKKNEKKYLKEDGSIFDSPLSYDENFTENISKNVPTFSLRSSLEKPLQNVNYREKSANFEEKHDANKEKRMSYREKREAHMHLLREKDSKIEEVFK